MRRCDALPPRPPRMTSVEVAGTDANNDAGRPRSAMPSSSRSQMLSRCFRTLSPYRRERRVGLQQQRDGATDALGELLIPSDDVAAPSRRKVRSIHQTL